MTTRVPMPGLYPLAVGDVVLLIDGASERYATVAALPGKRGLVTTDGTRSRRDLTEAAIRLPQGPARSAASFHAGTMVTRIAE